MNRREFLKYSVVASLALSGRTGAAEMPPASGAAVRKRPFILGADISWLLEDEAQGATYFDRGVQRDIFQILKSYRFNFVRARIFVNPHAAGGYSARRNEAFCDLEHTKKFAT
ncbi:MAG: glycosyl hydrolase 53 family protein, partial [Tepidisphaeraceae bacterium]